MSESKKDVVLDVVARLTGVDRGKLAPQMDLAGDLGIDSPKALELLVELESALSVEISDDDAARMETLGDVLEHVSKIEACA
ncbi:MAG: acyl carrier protein [Planctomycetes bacterium]|nr:acyl carrier protein [Planctomycetota bacterium]